MCAFETSIFVHGCNNNIEGRSNVTHLGILSYFTSGTNVFEILKKFNLHACFGKRNVGSPIKNKLERLSSGPQWDCSRTSLSGNR